jgi:hypothetical protein
VTAASPRPSPPVEARENRHGNRSGNRLTVRWEKESAPSNSWRNIFGRGGADHFLLKPTTTNRLAIIIQTLYDCAMPDPRDFNALTRLPEYQPAPGARRTANPASPRPITNI